MSHQHHHQHEQHRHHRNKASSESLHAATAASTEHATVQNYQPPAVSQSTFFGHANMSPPNPPPKPIDYVYNPSDGSVLLDHNGRPISVDKLLATKPLRGELSTRPGPGNKKLTYISGDGISRTLNDIFGFDGWNLDITSVQREETMQNQGKYTVVYTAQVRLTHKASGAYKEDCGAGDATDKSFATAVGHALKQSITDAMKRAARHFGDKLGNCK
jgi:DNA recombination protein Rad52